MKILFTYLVYNSFFYKFSENYEALPVKRKYPDT